MPGSGGRVAVLASAGTATLPVICETDQDLEDRIAAEHDLRKRWRQVKGTRHGADCDCGTCMEAHDGVQVLDSLELVTVPGITTPAEDGEPMVPKKHLAQFHPAARRKDGGPLVVDWNLPHHGEGAADCGEFLERVGGVHPDTKNLSWWARVKRCGQRDCQRCGPVIEDGKVLEAGTWEIRSARRATEAIKGHMEDRRKGLTKERVGGEKQVRLRDNTVRMQRRPHRNPPRIAHIVWSPAPSRWDDLPAHEKTKNRLDNLYREAYRDLKEVGVTGGYAVTHGLRIPSRWNERKHAVEGLHLHVLGLTKCYKTGRIDGAEVKRINQKRGTVIKKVTNHSDATDVAALNDDTAEGPSPNRSVFGSLLYLLSHATWPNLAVLREPGEDFEHRRRAVVFLRSYPAFVKTSTQTKAIRPFGEWVHAPETVVVEAIEEDTCPITGHGFAESEVWPVLFAKPPPADEDMGIVLRGRFQVDHDARVFRVGDVDYTPPTGEQARIMARMAGKPVPAPAASTDPAEPEARRLGEALAARLNERHLADREWEL